MSTMDICLIDLVLIAGPEWCEGSWHNQSHAEELTRGDR